MGAGTRVQVRLRTADTHVRNSSGACSLGNVIDVYMGRLRRKMDVDGLPPIIHTIRGVGHTLREGGG